MILIIFMKYNPNLSLNLPIIWMRIRTYFPFLSWIDKFIITTYYVNCINIILFLLLNKYSELLITIPYRMVNLKLFHVIGSISQWNALLFQFIEWNWRRIINFKLKSSLLYLKTRQNTFSRFTTWMINHFLYFIIRHPILWKLFDCIINSPLANVSNSNVCVLNTKYNR